MTGTEIDILEDGGLAEFDQSPDAGTVIAAGGAMQQVKTAHTTAIAVQQPRNQEVVLRMLQQEARIAGELFYFGWGAGKNKIQGASIGLANAAARCWGNCAVEMQPVQDMGDSWIFTATFVDLETGFTLNRQFRQSKKSEIYGKFDEERKDDMRFQIGQSKAVRNVICNALPKWLIDKARAAAQLGVRDKLERFINEKGIPAAVEIVTKELAKSGVKEEAIAAKFSIASCSALSIENLVVLRGDITAIQTGQETAESLFPDTQGDALEAAVNKPKKKSEPTTKKKAAPKKAAPKPAPKPADPAKPAPVEKVVALVDDLDENQPEPAPPKESGLDAAMAKKAEPEKPAEKDSEEFLEKDSMQAMREEEYMNAFKDDTDVGALAEHLSNAEEDKLITPNAMKRLKTAAQARSMDF